MKNGLLPSQNYYYGENRKSRELSRELELKVIFSKKNSPALYEVLGHTVKFVNYIAGLGERDEEQKFHFMEGTFEENRKITIEDCIDQLLQSEKLSAMNSWYCNVCKEQKEAVKKTNICRVPPLLILNLKRFKNAKQKTQSLVHFPINGLDMAAYVTGEQKETLEHYNLAGVTCHHGNLESGHYVAYAKNGDYWYEFNDEKVTPVLNPDPEIITSAAYNLFYVRQDLDENYSADFENLR